MKIKRIKKWNLYLVTEEELSSGRKTIEIVRQAIAGGVDVIQLRDKNLSIIDRYQLGKEIRKLTLAYNIDFIVNDRIDLAIALEADGVHLGQEDLPLEIGRKIMGPEKIIGISVSNVGEAKLAESRGADYLGVGSIFPTDSKKIKNDRISVGTEGVAKIKAESTLPLVVIGGLNRDNCEPIIRSGANAIAVITALTRADNVAEEARLLKETIVRAKKAGDKKWKIF